MPSSVEQEESGPNLMSSYPGRPVNHGCKLGLGLPNSCHPSPFKCFCVPSVEVNGTQWRQDLLPTHAVGHRHEPHGACKGSTIRQVAGSTSWLASFRSIPWPPVQVAPLLGLFAEAEPGHGIVMRGESVGIGVFQVVVHRLSEDQGEPRPAVIDWGGVCRGART